jgi:hypothetical protein
VIKMRFGMGGMLAAAVALAAPAVGVASVKLTRVGTIPGTGGPVTAFVRTADGRLHLVYPTSDSGAQGLTSRSISPSGSLDAAVSALGTDWGVSAPGLVQLPGGSLEALFGAVSPAAPHPDDTWGIASTDGGTTWSAPAIASSGGPGEAQAYSAAVTAQVSGSTPVLLLTVSGTLVAQQGLGPGSPFARVDTVTDGFPSATDSALDAASGQVVAGWDSLAQTTGGSYLQSVAPAPGTAEKVPGESRPTLTIAGRDKGPGVFAAYTSDDRHVRLLRYGGGSVAVGTLAAVRPSVMGVATGIDGRMWVMWGADGGRIALTRSNKAVTRFEPVQKINGHILTLQRLYGDGRLGPLDLLVDELPDVTPSRPTGVYHARALPELSAAASVTPVITIKNKKKVVTGHTVTLTVTDAGDAVKGATVTIKGHVKNSNASGVAKVTLAGDSTKHVTATVTAAAYQKLKKKISL